jgi:hypothetical protein
MVQDVAIRKGRRAPACELFHSVQSDAGTAQRRPNARVPGVASRPTGKFDPPTEQLRSEAQPLVEGGLLPFSLKLG